MLRNVLRAYTTESYYETISQKKSSKIDDEVISWNDIKDSYYGFILRNYTTELYYGIILQNFILQNYITELKYVIILQNYIMELWYRIMLRPNNSTISRQMYSASMDSHPNWSHVNQEPRKWWAAELQAGWIHIKSNGIQWRVNKIITFTAPGWIHTKFDKCSIKNQSNNEL